MNEQIIIITTQLLILLFGTIILIKAGKQDNQTRKPILLIPALIIITASTLNITLTLIISILGLIFLLLPAKINKIMGKADLYLLTTQFIILISPTYILLKLIIITTNLLTAYDLHKKQKNEPIPLIHYYAKNAYYPTITSITIILTTIIIGAI